jgi:glycogen phosphorylase
MEFLIGRSLANNILNFLTDPVAKRFMDENGLDPLALIEEEPDAGLGNGGLGRLAACFVDSMATMQLPAMATGSDMSMACSGNHRESLATRAAGQLASAA